MRMLKNLLIKQKALEEAASLKKSKSLYYWRFGLCLDYRKILTAPLHIISFGAYF